MTASTKRYFYRCPISSLFMAKHFGMRFRKAYAGGGGWKEIDLAYLLGDCNAYMRMTESEQQYIRSYIHPDSLPILDNIPPREQAALQLVGLWPESEP